MGRGERGGRGGGGEGGEGGRGCRECLLASTSGMKEGPGEWWGFHQSKSSLS